VAVGMPVRRVNEVLGIGRNFEKVAWMSNSRIRERSMKKKLVVLTAVAVVLAVVGYFVLQFERAIL
jgi:hypothetical protein